ncbi:MAG: RNB domain-containing ribonuclease, partial [Lentisphaeria bacterium]|nr:RNB domain-containing ribonuclease [Lentisphaeria bacterium]
MSIGQDGSIIVEKSSYRIIRSPRRTRIALRIAVDGAVEISAPVNVPQAVLDESAAIPDTLPAEDLAGRDDWRDRCVITIDPPSARDFDDAVSVRRIPGGWELAVHIADVSHYVRPGSALDREAEQRGNSTYLPDRVL